MSCEHGEWHDCERCEEVDRAYGDGIKAGIALATKPASTGSVATLAEELKAAPFNLSPHMAYDIARHIDARQGVTAPDDPQAVSDIASFAAMQAVDHIYERIGFTDRDVLIKEVECHIIANMNKSYAAGVRDTKELASLSAPIATFEGYVDGKERISWTGEPYPVGTQLYAVGQGKASDAEDWQPIETAPKDGTVVMLFADATVFEGKPVGQRVTMGQWEEWVNTASEYHGTTGEYLGQSEQDGGASWISWDGGFTEENPPSHWQPLPAPPDAARAQQQEKGGSDD